MRIEIRRLNQDSMLSLVLTEYQESRGREEKIEGYLSNKKKKGGRKGQPPRREKNEKKSASDRTFNTEPNAFPALSFHASSARQKTGRPHGVMAAVTLANALRISTASIEGPSLSSLHPFFFGTYAST